MSIAAYKAIIQLAQPKQQLLGTYKHGLVGEN